MLSNGDPVTFGKIKSKDEADNLGAWINHLLGVQVETEEEVEEVKAKEIVEDILNKSFGLLEEAEEEKANDSSLLEELCHEEEEEDLVLADVEETVDFFEVEVRGLLKKHYPEDVEEISTSVDEPIDNKEVDDLEEEMFKEISYVSFTMPIVESFDQEVSLEIEETDEAEYLPGTLEITGEAGHEVEEEDLELADGQETVDSFEMEVRGLLKKHYPGVEETSKPADEEIENKTAELKEAEHNLAATQVEEEVEEEKLQDELEFDVEGEIREASPNMPSFVHDEIVEELNKVEWLQLVSKDVDEEEEEESESEEEVDDAEMTEEEWFELVSETDADVEKMSSIYQIEEYLLENFLAVDKFGLGDGEIEEEEEEEEEIDEKVEERVEVENMEIPKEKVENVESTTERKDVSLQTELDSDDEDDELRIAELLEKEEEEEENKGNWNETIEQHVEETIEAVVSMQTEKMPENEKAEEIAEMVTEAEKVEKTVEEPSAEVVPPPKEENIATPSVEKTPRACSEDLKCPMCEKPPFKAAELLKHLTSSHFAKQMAETYKLEENLPCHLCIKEGREKPYKMTRFSSSNILLSC